MPLKPLQRSSIAASILCCSALSLPLATLHAQAPDAILRQAVDSERAANHNDHSHWIYLEETRKPKEHLVQWVAATDQGDVPRVIEKDGQKIPDPQQRDAIQKYLHDPKAQKKQVAETSHDNQQVDDLLKLLPDAFVWTETKATATDTFLHFEPAPNYHPPTREARVFSGMAGDLVIDNQQHRIRSMNGRLVREVTFGGGLLGKLKEGSSFSLEQAQVAPSLWQLTELSVHLQGNALLFKSISLQEEDKRTQFAPEPATVTLDQAAATIMNPPPPVSSTQ
jgi:hypothetical protein